MNNCTLNLTLQSYVVLMRKLLVKKNLVLTIVEHYPNDIKESFTYQ